jgi:O-antigen/teichoic acid export membrane protein
MAGSAAKEGYLAAFDQGLISLANFLATVILARAASPTELGVYGVGFTALRLVRAVQEGIAIQPINTFGPGLDEMAFRQYATRTSLIQILFSLASSAGVALLGWALTELGNDTAGPAVFSLWFVFLFWQLQEYVRRMLYARGQVRSAVINTSLSNGLRLFLMLWFFGSVQLDGVRSLDAIAWGSLAALIPGLWQTRRFWSFQSLWDWKGLLETWQKNWGFGRWLLGGNLANWIAVEFYPVLTAGLISFAAAGAYRALQNLVAPIHLLLRATDTFLTPRAARLYEAGGLPALKRSLRLTYLITGLPILGLLIMGLLFPRPILFILYGDTYIDYSQGMSLMAVFYALWFSYWPLQTGLKATKKSRPIFIANMAAIAAMFTAGIWMIYRYGVYGTIGGQILNSAIVAVILWAAWLYKPSGSG